MTSGARRPWRGGVYRGVQLAPRLDGAAELSPWIEDVDHGTVCNHDVPEWGSSVSTAPFVLMCPLRAPLWQCSVRGHGGLKHTVV